MNDIDLDFEYVRKSNLLHEQYPKNFTKSENTGDYLQ
jgi:hypothetical protein